MGLGSKIPKREPQYTYDNLCGNSCSQEVCPRANAQDRRSFLSQGSVIPPTRFLVGFPRATHNPSNSKTKTKEEMIMMMIINNNNKKNRNSKANRNGNISSKHKHHSNVGVGPWNSLGGAFEVISRRFTEKTLVGLLAPTVEALARSSSSCVYICVHAYILHVHVYVYACLYVHVYVYV